MSDVTVLGLGAMGSRIARNLADAGHDVTVWNRTSSVADRMASEHGLVAADSVPAAVERAEVVVSMLSDDEASTAVWLDPEHGAAGALPAGALAIESSTITPSTVRRIGTSVVEGGARFVEAPVVGSRPQADAGALFYLLGGDEDAVAASRPVLDANAGAARHVGGIGDAAVVKLAINGLFGIQVATYAELAGMLRRSGVDHDVVTDIVAGLPVTSPALARIIALVRDHRFEPNFPIELVAKDLGYLADLGASLDADLPLATASRDVFRDGVRIGIGGLDIAGIAERYSG